MSRYSKESSGGYSPLDNASVFCGTDPGRPAHSPKEWSISCLLFAVTAVSVSLAGLFYVFGLFFMDSVLAVSARPGLILYGLQYSIPLIIILLAHEMGHYFACRYYGLRCTPPYFIPVPVSITGTLGAFIKIKSPFPNRRALFDVGIAGPLAGFMATIPTLCIGISLSRVLHTETASSGGIFFGEPLVFRILAAALLNYNPASDTLMAHPVASAGWFGLLVTSLNLLPVWQLDGGHIVYAAFGSRHHVKISITVLVLLIFVGLYGLPTPSYLVFGLLIFILGLRYKFFHPPTLLDREPLGTGRTVLAVVALFILVLCFTPVPVEINF